MSKRAKVHFLTLYVEYLLDQGIRSEEYYLGDASRFLRHLLATATPPGRWKSIFLQPPTPPLTAGAWKKTLRKFFIFAEERLAISPPELPPRGIKKDQIGTWSGNN